MPSVLVFLTGLLSQALTALLKKDGEWTGWFGSRAAGYLEAVLVAPKALITAWMAA